MRIIKADNTNSIIDYILNEIVKRAEDKNQDFILFASEKYSLSLEKALLVKSSVKAITNIFVLTPSRLLHRLVKEENNYIPKETGIMIIKKLIIDNYDKLVCFKKTAKTMGFAESVYDTISGLKNSGVTPEDYYKKIEGVDYALKIKLSDIFLLYSAYEKFINEKNMVDACDRFGLLGNLISVSDFIKRCEVYAFGFDNMSSAGMQVFESLIKTAKSFSIGCVDFSGKNNSYVYKPEMLNSIENLCEKLLIEPTRISLKSGENNVVSHIRNNMFAYPYLRKQISNEVKLVECMSENEEVEFVAENIRRSIIEKGFRYADINIACSNLEKYADIIESVFSKYDIPYFIDRQEKLIKHPLTSFMISMLNCYKRNFASDEFVLLFKNFFAGINYISQNELENYILKYGINYDRIKKPFVYGKVDYKGEKVESFDNVELTRKTIVDKLLKVYDCFDKSKKCKDYVKACLTFFDLFAVDDLMEMFMERLSDSKQFVMFELSKQVKDKICLLLEEIDKILGDDEIPFDEFYAMIIAGLQAQKVSLIPITVDNCFVGDISLSKFLSVKDLYVIGAVEGSVPKVVDDCGLIVDKEIKNLSESLEKSIEPTIRTINQRERYKIIALFENFNNRLVVSYSAKDSQGKEQKPSSVILDLSKIFYIQEGVSLKVMPVSQIKKFRERLTESEKVKSYAYEFATKEVAFVKLLNYLRDYKNGKVSVNQNVAINSLYAYLLENLSSSYKNLLMYKEVDFKLDKPQDLFFPNKKTSISQLETYFSCPYKFFASYGLMVKEREDSELRSVDFGNILHKIAEKYIKRLDYLETIKVTNSKIREIQKIIDSVFEEEKIQVASNKYIVRILKNESVRLINALNFQLQLSNFKPIEEELVFGEKGKVKGLDLGGGISLEGKIDRVDKLGDSIRVIDYKTGYIDLSPNNVYYGNKIQLFVYLNALKNAKLKPVGSFYFPIKDIYADEKSGDFINNYMMQGYFVDDVCVVRNMDRDLSLDKPKSRCLNAKIIRDKNSEETNDVVLAKQSHILPEETLNGVIEYTNQLSKKAVKEILDGNIIPTPIVKSGKPICSGCPFNNICRLDKSNPKLLRNMDSLSFDDFAICDNEKGGADNE